MGETPQYPHGPGAGQQPGHQPLWQPGSAPGRPHGGPVTGPSAPPTQPPAQRPARSSRTGLIAGATGVGALAIGLLLGWLVLPHSDGDGGDLPDPETAAPGEYEIALGCELVRTLDGEFSDDMEPGLSSPAIWRGAAAGNLLFGAEHSYAEYDEFAEPGRDLLDGANRLDLERGARGVTDAIALCDERGF